MYTKPPSTSETTTTPAQSKSATSGFADLTADKVADIAHQAEQIATRVAEQGHEATENIKAVAGNLKGAVDKSIKDQPMATLALITIAGFVLGAIWKA